MDKKNICLISVIIGCLVAYLIIDGLFLQELFSFNHDIVSNWQQDLNWKKYGQAFSTLVGDLPLEILIIVIWFFGTDKVKAVKFICYTSLSPYLEHSLKMLYIYPRPFMVFPDIMALDCSKDFGKPSGHALNGLVMYSLLFYFYINPWLTNSQNKLRSKVDRDEYTNPCIRVTIKVITALPWSIFGWGICSFLIVAIGLSRIYLGVHSIDQIISGWIYGILFLLLAINILDRRIEEFTASLIQKQNPKGATIILLTLMAFCLAIPLSLYELRMIGTSYNPEWLTSLEVKCQINLLHNKDNIFLAVNFAQTGKIMGLFGLFVAMLSVEGEYAETEEPSTLPLYKEISRFMIIVIAFLLPELALGYVPSTLNPFLTFFIQQGLRTFLMTATLLAIPPIIFYYLKMDKEGDFLRRHQYVVDLERSKILKLPQDTDFKFLQPTQSTQQTLTQGATARTYAKETFRDRDYWPLYAHSPAQV